MMKKMTILSKTVIATVVVASVGLLIAALLPSQQQAYADNHGNAAHENYAQAVFGGGCFWCVEKDFEGVKGVIEAVSGYSGGDANSAEYKKVASGGTRHIEVVKVVYDDTVINYATLLQYFWRQIDPTDAGGQFVDRGNQYRPVIFYANAQEQQIAQQSLDDLAKSGRYEKPMAVLIAPLEAFYEAEDYHQDYYKKSPIRYNSYRYGSGRDQYLKKVWGEDLKKVEAVINSNTDNAQAQQSMHNQEGFSMPYSKPSDEELKQRLNEMQYRVTQKDGTEPPFQNEYHDEKRDGIYVDIVSGEPLFSSIDKYDSGTGWPSFSQPLETENIVTKKDYKMILPRTEVRSKYADSHLGHVFNDGPDPTGLRYCMNSAAMRFIAKEDLEKEGYAKYLSLFEQ